MVVLCILIIVLSSILIGRINLKQNCQIVWLLMLKIFQNISLIYSYGLVRFVAIFIREFFQILLFSNQIQNMHDRIQYIHDHLFVSVIIQFKQMISVTIFCVVVIMFKMSSMKSAHFRTGKDRKSNASQKDIKMLLEINVIRSMPKRFTYIPILSTMKVNSMPTRQKIVIGGSVNLINFACPKR